MRSKVVVFTICAALLSTTGFAAEAPATPDPLVSCRSDLAVTGQYAVQMAQSRTVAEQDLARARALIADLQSQIEALKKPAEPKK